jgi:guanylate cyclase, other
LYLLFQVVKLSDFGLFAFKQGVEEKIENPADLLKCENSKSKQQKDFAVVSVQIFFFFLELLYRAPELLRAASDACIPGSQKGDVYSFAIILYETHTRHGPFGEIDCSAMECLG